jgi:DHA1 family multidrug resistance protein-like MFS transporter
MKEVILLFVINTLSSLGYSLIAPLYPPLAKERAMPEYLIGLVISAYALIGFVITPLCPKIIKMFGRKKVLYTAIGLEVYYI